MKNIRFFYLKIFVFDGEIFNIFEKVCFRNEFNKYSEMTEPLEASSRCHKLKQHTRLY